MKNREDVRNKFLMGICGGYAIGSSVVKNRLSDSVTFKDMLKNSIVGVEGKNNTTYIETKSLEEFDRINDIVLDAKEKGKIYGDVCIKFNNFIGRIS